MQIFLTCYFGEYVIQTSSKLTIDAFSCNWIELLSLKLPRKRFGKAFVILMERLQRNMNVTVGLFIPLSLTTFKSVSCDVNGDRRAI